MHSDFYRAFEDKYRGSRELIKSRLQVYLPFIKPLLDKKQETKALDLGCGRGEWLELLIEQGFIAQGVDIDEGMLEACWELDLKAEKADVLDHLKSLKANSFAIISGFHIAEHISFEMLQELVDQALRILKPGGLLILETPNPENIVVGTANFYLDPTHQRPLPPLLLSFIAEHAGYARVKILRLQEPEGLQESQNLTLIDVLSGVSPDFSIVAQKAAAKNTLKKFDAAFSKEYGVMLNEIANLYDGQLKSKTDDMRTKWSDEHQRAEQLAVELSATREQKAAAEANQHHQWRLEKETTQQEFLLALMEKETRLQEFTSTGIENKQKIDKLHVSLIDSKEQQEVLKTTLKEIRQQRLQLETQVKTLQVEANQHGQWRLEKETTQQEFLLALMEKETRLQEFTSTGIENKQQIDKLHVSLIDSKEQQEALKTALREIGQQRLQLETQWSSEHQRAEQLAVDLIATREQKAAAETVKEQFVRDIQSMEQRIEVANREKAELNTEYSTELDREHQRAEQLAIELCTTREQRTAAEAAKEELIQDILSMNQLIEAANNEKAELKIEYRAELDNEYQRSEQLKAELDRERQGVKQLVAELSTIKEQIEHLNLNVQSKQDEKNAAMEKIYELECISHHWWLEANRLTNSRSWRITLPLRLTGRLARWCLFLPVRFARMVKRLLKKVLRPVLLLAMRLILRQPVLKRAFSALLRHFPSLHNKLQRVAANARSRSQSSISNKSFNQSSLPFDTASEHRINKNSEELNLENNIDLFISRIYGEIDMRNKKEGLIRQGREI